MRNKLYAATVNKEPKPVYKWASSETDARNLIRRDYMRMFGRCNITDLKCVGSNPSRPPLSKRGGVRKENTKIVASALLSGKAKEVNGHIYLK